MQSSFVNEKHQSRVRHRNAMHHAPHHNASEGEAMMRAKEDEV
jgi:hypothetical protein